MTITAKVIAHSSFQGSELITMELHYPRFIHAEFMTHRVFSRNASSSRATPVLKLIEQIEADPAMPVEFGKNKPGMQSTEVVDDPDLVKSIWLGGAEEAIRRAKVLHQLGAHKQVINRILEPYAHIRVIVTATEWSNFYDLRISPEADPTMNELAVTMLEAKSRSKPVTLNENQYHLPYITEDERKFIGDGSILSLVSTARCARVSYLNHDQSHPDMDKDIVLAQRLRTSQHWSPFEHQAKVHHYAPKGFYRNFAQPWAQHRAMAWG